MKQQEFRLLLARAPSSLRLTISSWTYWKVSVGTEFPAKDIDQLIGHIDGTIDEANSFLLSLNNDLPESYDKAAFDSKVSLLMNHFVDMAVQGYGWIGVA